MGRRATFLTDAPAIYNGPKWSPDGSRILFTAGGKYQIYSMRAGGTDLFQLTDNHREHRFLTGSPGRATRSSRRRGVGAYTQTLLS
jgi:Tol biopolymer transport system component